MSTLDVYSDARMDLLVLEPEGKELLFYVNLIMDEKGRIETILDPVRKEADCIWDNFIIS